MNQMMLQSHWERNLHSMLDMIERFPKSQRFVFGQPMAQDIVQILVGLQQARYLPKSHQAERLLSINQRLDTLRVLFRVCHDRRYLSTKQLEWLTTQFQITGSGLHQWLKTAQTLKD